MAPQPPSQSEAIWPFMLAVGFAVFIAGRATYRFKAALKRVPVAVRVLGGFLAFPLAFCGAVVAMTFAREGATWLAAPILCVVGAVFLFLGGQMLMLAGKDWR